MSTPPDPWFSAHAAIAAHIADPRCALAREVIRVMGYMEPMDPTVRELRRAVQRDVSSAADHSRDPAERAALNRAWEALALIDRAGSPSLPLAELPTRVAACLNPNPTPNTGANS